MKTKLSAQSVANSVMVLGLLLSALLSYWQVRHNAEIIDTTFGKKAEQVARQIAQRMAAYELGLTGVRGAVIAIDPMHINAHTFKLYVASRDMDQEFPGVRGFGLIRRVTVDEEPLFLAAARRDGRPAFAIRQLAPHDGERFVIDYIEPVTRNTQAVGLDIASEQSRRTAALTAMRTGQATLTAPITLVQAKGHSQRSFLLLLPVYKTGMSLSTPAARDAATFGWVYAPLVTEEVLKDIDYRYGGAIELSLRDHASDKDEKEFFATPGAHAPPAADTTRTIPIPIYGRTWQMEARATPEFVADLRLTSPRLLALTGCLLTLLCALLARLLATNALRAAALRTEQAHRNAIVETAHDAMIGATLDGQILSWNPAAERIFGYTNAEAIGRSIDTLVPPEGRETHEPDVAAIVRAGQTVLPFDTKRIRRDGSLVEVAISASPLLGADGQVIGIGKTVRDISAYKTAERELRELSDELERKVTERTASLDAARHDLRNILDTLPSMISYWDRHLINRFANRAHLSWFDKDPASLPGQHMRDVLGENLFELNRPHIELALLGQAQTFERAVPRPDGTGHRHALTHYLPDVVDGEVKGFYVQMHDITELTLSRQREAAATRDNELLLKTINEHAIVSVTDKSGRITDVNDAFCRISGYDRRELLGQNHRIINSGHHSQTFWRGVWRTIASGTAWRGEICNRAKNGECYWVDSIVAPFFGEDGRIEKYISIRFDVTAARQAERALRESEAFLDRTGEVAGIGGWEYDLRSQRIKWSRQVYRIHEVDPDITPDIAMALAFYPDKARGELQQLLERAVSEGAGWDIELPFVTRTGRSRWVRVVGEVEMREGAAVRLLGAFQDITERRKTDEQLRSTSERFALAADSAGIGVWVYDVVNNTLTWDDWMYRMYGAQRAAGLEPYALWADHLHPEDRAESERNLQACISGEREFDTEFRIIWPNGEVRHIKATAQVQRDRNGRALRMIGVNFDITERKRGELELAETTSLLRMVLASASEVSVIATDPDLVIKVFNSGAQRMLGYSSDEVVGIATPMLIHDAAEVQAASEALSLELGRPISGGAVFTDAAVQGKPREWTYVHKDGHRLTVSLVVTGMRSDSGALLGYVGIAHDVTKQKAQEQSLRDAMNRAEQASLAKSQFLANMSHEIRTPMNAVMGLTYLLSHSSLDAEQRDFVQRINLASKSLLGVINDILDLSKIEAGELSIERAPFCPATVLAELTQLMRVQTEAKGLLFDVRGTDDLPPVLVGDALRLSQILTNLLSNAIKFTPQGGVSLTVRSRPMGATHVGLRFEVQDSGIGIAPDVAAGLFQPFAQADASTTRRFGGTGLGLSIVKQLTEMMGGRVGLDSRPHHGSRFWVELEFKIGDAQSPPPHPDKGGATEGQLRLPGVRVLVVDDSQVNLEVAKRILEMEGAVVTLAGDGHAAVAHLRTHVDDIDIVLMDVQMPVMDGLSATKLIRGELKLGHLPIIALTAGAMTSERQLAKDVGMNDFIGKPFDPNALIDRIIRQLPAATQVRRSAQGARAPMATSASPPADWAPIQGIAMGDVAARLGGDIKLFCSLLRRFLAEFATLALPDGLPERDMLTATGHLMHKLRGSAGNVGATKLSELAALAEQTCRQGPHDALVRQVQALNAEIARLQADVERFLQQHEPSFAPVPPGADASIDPDDLRELLRMLRQQNVAALDQFQTLANGLQCRLGPELFAQVRDKLDMLQFNEVADMLAGEGLA